MPTSIELREQRARTVETMREIHERAEAENRDLDAQEREAYDRGEADFRSFTSRIERQELLERTDAEQGRSLDGGPNIPGGEERSQQVRSAFLAFARRGMSGISQEQRALVEDTVGEIIVPEDLETEIVRDLPENSVIRPLARVRPTTRNRVRRRSLTEVTVGWGKLETGATLNESSPTPDDDWLYVEDLYGLAKIGEDELADTDVNLEAFLSDSFGRAIAEASDTGFVKGTGHANEQPQGIFATGTGIDVTTSGASTYEGTGANAPGVLIDDLKNLIYGVKGTYRRNGVYLFSTTTEARIATVKDANGQYLWQQAIAAGRPATFNGYPIHSQDDVDSIAASKQIAAFGDVKAGYTILDRKGLGVQRLVELYAEDGLVGFKVHARVGGGVVRPKAFNILKTKA